jgi:hypothetical protein
MKKLLLTLFTVVAMVSTSVAQSTIEQSFSTEGIKDLKLDFTYPELVKIKVWDKNEVSIKGIVEIENDDSDDFSITNISSKGRLTIQSELKNIDRHKGFTIYASEDEDGETVTVSKDGKSINVGQKKGMYSNGIRISIVLEVTVPRNLNVIVNATYGLVEIIEYPKSIEVDAKYGGIDLSIDEKSEFALEARTQWGQIFSNLNTAFNFDGSDNMGKWLKASASINSGSQKMKLESQYGNVYLRKN